jgi:hypothetical protein
MNVDFFKMKNKNYKPAALATPTKMAVVTDE